MTRSGTGVLHVARHNRRVPHAIMWLLLILPMLGCRSDVQRLPEPQRADDAMQDHPVPEALEVLAVRSRLTRVGAGGSPTLELELDVPTGGHGLAVADGEGVLGEDGVYVAMFDLMGPGNQEIVTQAVETLSAEFEIPTGAERCVVRVRRWVRGWSYIVAPESFVVAEHDVRG
jgi:hypothetical protein